MRARFRKKESRSFFLSVCAHLAFNVKTTSFWYDLWAGGNSVIESIKGGLFYENGGERMTVKLRKGSQIPTYMAYSDDRRKAASELAKKRGIHTKP